MTSFATQSNIDMGGPGLLGSDVSGASRRKSKLISIGAGLTLSGGNLVNTLDLTPYALLPDTLPAVGTLLSYGGSRQLAAGGTVTHSGDVIMTGSANGIYLNPENVNKGLIYFSAGQNRLNGISSVPWVVESDAGFKVRNTANSADGPITCGTITASGRVTVPVMTTWNNLTAGGGIVGSGGVIIGTISTNQFLLADSVGTYRAFSDLSTNGYFNIDKDMHFGWATVTGQAYNSSDVRLYRYAPTSALNVQAAGGLRVLNLAGSADAAMTVGTITASGNLTLNGASRIINLAPDNTAYTYAGILGTSGSRLEAYAGGRLQGTFGYYGGFDGLLLAEGTAYGPRILLGGTTSSFPAIKRSSAAIALRLADDSADAALTCGAITASGNVGIGTVTLTAPLNVQAASSGALGIDIYGRVSNNSSLINFYTNAGASQSYIASDSVNGLSIAQVSNLAMHFSTNNVERLTIANSGAITASGQLQATASGLNATFGPQSGTAAQYAYFGNGGGRLWLGAESSVGGGIFTGSAAYASVIGTSTATSFQIATNNVVRTTWDSSGNASFNGAITASGNVTLPDLGLIRAGSSGGNVSIGNLTGSGIQVWNNYVAVNGTLAVSGAITASGTVSIQTDASNKWSMTGDSLTGTDLGSPTIVITRSYGGTINLTSSGYLAFSDGGSTNSVFDTKFKRKGIGQLATCSSNGLAIRNYADSADAAMTCGAITASGNVNIGANSLVSTYSGIYNEGKWLTGSDGYGSFYISPSNAAFAFAPPAAGTIVGSIDYQGRFNALLGFGVGSHDPASTTVRYYRNATGPKASIRAAGGLEVKDLAGSADAALTCGAITASGAIQETPTQSASDPTTTDIPTGKRMGWYNSTLGEFRDWVNIGGTLKKSAAYT